SNRFSNWSNTVGIIFYLNAAACARSNGAIRFFRYGTATTGFYITNNKWGVASIGKLKYTNAITTFCDSSVVHSVFLESNFCLLGLCGKTDKGNKSHKS